MMKWGERMAAKADEEQSFECETLIVTLASLSEIVAWNGFGILERIYTGVFDEADLHCEEIPEMYRSKVNLRLIQNDFFGDLIFAFLMTDDYEYACQLMETHIVNADCSEKDYRDLVLQYMGMRMICQKRLPWEIEYSLYSIVKKGKSLIKCIKNYMKGTENYEDCIKRYRSHWQKGKDSTRI